MHRLLKLKFSDCRSPGEAAYRGSSLSWRQKLCLSLLLVPGHVLMAEPVVKEETHYYSVKVDSVAQMQAALDRATPIRENGKVFHGYTDSRVNWSWWWRREDGVCQIEKVESEVVIQYTLPRLNTDDRNFQVRGVWSDWFWALQQHEHQHGRHAIETARLGEAEIMAIAPHPDCAIVDEKATAIATSLVAALKARDADYDRRTRHGETEIKRLPGRKSFFGW